MLLGAGQPGHAHGPCAQGGKLLVASSRCLMIRHARAVVGDAYQRPVFDQGFTQQAMHSG